MNVQEGTAMQLLRLLHKPEQNKNLFLRRGEAAFVGKVTASTSLRGRTVERERFLNHRCAEVSLNG